MKFTKTSRLASVVLMASLVAACGGGGSPTPTSTVAGTAATGAAIASGTVTLKCVSGTTTSATTGTDGSFSIDVTGVTLPCVGRVDYKDSTGAAQKLHTFISAAGTANITPVTDLLVANLTTGAAADAFDKFDAAKAKAFTAAQIKAAADAVKTYLKNTLGVDTSKLPDDPVGTKLKAAVGSTAGDDFDKVLDDLQAKLKSKGKKLTEAGDDLVKGGASTGGTGTGGGSSKDGPSVDKAALAALCPNNLSSTVLNKCKKTSSGSVGDPVLTDINAWFKSNGTALKVTSAAFGAKLGETCTFQFETFLGIAVLSTPSMSTYATEQFTGSVSDEIDLDKNGLVGYLSAGDDFSTGSVGKLEVNFPSIASGVLEVIYGKGGTFLSCSTAPAK